MVCRLREDLSKRSVKERCNTRGRRPRFSLCLLVVPICIRTVCGLRCWFRRSINIVLLVGPASVCSGNYSLKVLWVPPLIGNKCAPSFPLSIRITLLVKLSRLRPSLASLERCNFEEQNNLTTVRL